MITDKAPSDAVDLPPEGYKLEGCQFMYVSAGKYCGRTVAGTDGTGDAAYELCKDHLALVIRRWVK